MRSRVALVPLAAIAFAALAPRPAAAAWPHSSGTNLTICNLAGNQISPASIPDGAGGVILAWQDFRSGTADIYAQHVLASGVVDPTWPANGRAICTAANTQQPPLGISDGAGGAILVWADLRTGSYDIYAQHLLASGVVDGTWPADGRGVCTATNTQVAPRIVSDGSGGAIVAWQDFRNTLDYDLYAQHVKANGTVDAAWPANGRALCLQPTDQTLPAIVSDGAGGAIVGWQDPRSGNSDIYAQHVLAGGAVDALWPADGKVICSAAGPQEAPSIASDGAGGAVLTWQDDRGVAYDIYAQHVLASGVTDPAWAVDGQTVCTATGSQFAPVLVSDGANGWIIASEDVRAGNRDIYAHHLLASGAVDGSWTANGVALCTTTGDQVQPRIVTDGAGGAIVTWLDFRNTVDYDIYAEHVTAGGIADSRWPVNGRGLTVAPGAQIDLSVVSDGAGGAIAAWDDARDLSRDVYAQRVAASGYLGTPEPVMAGIKDVPNDQGGHVKVSWQASWLDTELPYVVDHYWIFRAAPPNIAAAALRHGARLLAPGDAAPARGERAFVVMPRSASAYYWEYLASSPAAHFTSTYSYVAGTTSDSVGGSNPTTAFMVAAYDAGNTLVFPSSPDSGYSVDNLAPAPPAPFEGVYLAGATHLHWGVSREADFATYRLHRGGSAGFVPGPGNLVTAQSDTGYADAGAAGSWYKLAALDSHGNESAFAVLGPGSTTAVDDGMPRAVWLARPSPNPAIGSVLMTFALPREQVVSLAIYDPSGRRVRVLASGAQSAGPHALTWDLRDESGHAVGAGLFFVRLEAAGRSLTERFATLR